MLTFIVPFFNADDNLENLLQSLYSQKNSDWNAIIINDGGDITVPINDKRVAVVTNDERRYALKNIVDIARQCDDIVAVIDGDDQLCNDSTVDIVYDGHEGETVLWTAHKWDINGLNISCALPDKINPYQYKWCSSHLKTFDASLLRKISDENFMFNGSWFKRGYDQALMLPLLFIAKKRKYIPEICYQYNINSCSMNKREWTERSQLQTVNIVRSRGFLG